MSRDVWHDINDPSGIQPQEKEEAKDEPPAPEPEAQKTKSPPEYRITSASVIVPADGLKKDRPFDFECEIEPLADKITKPRILCDVVETYQDKEDVIEAGIPFYIDEKTNRARGACAKLAYHKEYLADTEKPAEAKFNLCIRVSGEAAEKDFTSPPVDLPMETREIVLKKGMYDDTWAGREENAARYPKSGGSYVPGEKIKKLQENLRDFRLTGRDHATGYFGDITEAAVKDLQKYSQKQERKKASDTRVFKIDPDQVQYKGGSSGEVDAETEKEIAAWVQEKYVKPEPEYRKGDYDKEGRYNNPDAEKDFKGDPHYYDTREILDFQKLLRDVGAYLGKIDGWIGELTHKAIKLFQEHAEKGEFVDAQGNKVVLEEKDRLTGHREGVGCGKTKEKLNETKGKNLKVAAPGQKSVKDLCEKHWEAHKGDCSGFVKAVAKELNVALEGQANDIVDQIQKSPWKVLKDGIEADSEARAGKFVVAGLKDDEHGHVAVIVPGTLAHEKYPTGYWGRLNAVGKKNSTINWSWPEEERDSVIYAAITF